MLSPFAKSSARPGEGIVCLSLNPPSTPVLRTLTYQYPLKLVAPSPVAVTSAGNVQVQTLFLLTYGGGLVAGDTISLSLTLEASTRLILLTQGSTKIFKTQNKNVTSGQSMRVKLYPGASLCYLPDPVQPFHESAFQSDQVFELLKGESGEPSICLLDWVSEGRTARGEKWGFWRFGSRNEIWGVDDTEGAFADGARKPNRRLLLRDNVVLQNPSDKAREVPEGFVGRMDGLGVYGTLVVRGPLFEGLGSFFMQEFGKLPRIGARKWDTEPDDNVAVSPEESWRTRRQKEEAAKGVVWTAATLRGFVVIRFGAKAVEGARHWLFDMIRREGSVERQFGERALLCLR